MEPDPLGTTTLVVSRMHTVVLIVLHVSLSMDKLSQPHILIILSLLTSSIIFEWWFKN